MKKTFLLFNFLGLLAMPLTVGRTETPVTVPGPSVSAQVSLVSEPGLSLIDKATYQYDAGAVDTIRVPHWEHQFTLNNTSTKPLTVTGLRGSCGCETLLLQKGGTLVPTAKLAPGEQATIRLSVSLHSGQPGPARKYVWVDGPSTTDGQSAPLLTLQIDLQLQQSVSFQPRVLAFGPVESGAGAAQTLAVLFDPALFPGGTAPRLISADHDVQVQAVGPIQPSHEGGQPRMRQNYQVTLSPSAHAGRLSTEIFLDLPSGPTHTGTASRISLAVTGQIAGALDALPSSVFFGSLPAGKAVTRTIVLSLAAPAPSSSMTVTTSHSWLSATVASSPGASKHHLLSITLAASAPAGSLQEKATVTLSTGAHLDIPVIAELTK